MFLYSTIWEIGQMVDASVWRAKQDHKLRLHQAWHTAAFAGAAFSGKLPSLKRVLADKQQPQAMQTAEQQLAIMQQLGATLGLKYGES